MFTKSARFYDSLYAFKDYDTAAARLRGVLERCAPHARSLLDVGCGTGRHLAALAPHYDVAGLDLNADLLAVARERCPTVPLIQGDMADFDLGRRFDAVVCLFSAIGYVRTLDRMRAAIACFARHLAPGGCVVVEPWFTPDQYWTDTITANFVNEPDLKIAWMYTSKRADRVSLLDIHYMVGTPAGVEEFTELHEIGLFTREEHEQAFRDAGLAVDYDPVGLFNRGLYVGTAGGR